MAMYGIEKPDRRELHRSECCLSDHFEAPWIGHICGQRYVPANCATTGLNVSTYSPETVIYVMP